MNKYGSCSYTLYIEFPMKVTLAKGPKIGVIRRNLSADSAIESKPATAERMIFNAFARKPSMISAKPSQATPDQKKPHVGILKIK